MVSTSKISNLEKIERIENAVISIADIVSGLLMDVVGNVDELVDQVPVSKLPGMLLDTLTLWEKLDKIKTSELKRGEVDKPIITGALSGIPTSVLLSFVEVDTSSDLLSFMRSDKPVEFEEDVEEDFDDQSD